MALFDPVRLTARQRAGTPFGLVTLPRVGGNVIRFGASSQGRAGTPSALVPQSDGGGSGFGNAIALGDAMSCPGSGTKRNSVPGEAAKWHEAE